MDKAKMERTPTAFEYVFERFENSISLNKGLIEECKKKSSLLCGPTPSEMDDSPKESTSSEQTIISLLNNYCDSIDKNNSLLRYVLDELNKAI